MSDTLKCPYCGSENYSIYDSSTCYPDNIDYCVCDSCDGYFYAVYKFSHIEED